MNILKPKETLLKDLIQLDNLVENAKSIEIIEKCSLDMGTLFLSKLIK